MFAVGGWADFGLPYQVLVQGRLVLCELEQVVFSVEVREGPAVGLVGALLDAFGFAGAGLALRSRTRTK